MHLHFVNFQLAFIISFLPRCTGKCNCSPKWPFSGLQYQWTLVGTSQVFGNCQNIRHQSEFFEQRSLYIQKLTNNIYRNSLIIKNHKFYKSSLDDNKQKFRKLKPSLFGFRLHDFLYNLLYVKFYIYIHTFSCYQQMTNVI